jgi:DNA-binding LytR/AlgR family response regulator
MHSTRLTRQAIDYVLKPIDAPRIARAVQRLKKRLAARAGELERLLDQLRALHGPVADAPKLAHAARRNGQHRADDRARRGALLPGLPTSTRPS